MVLSAAGLGRGLASSTAAVQSSSQLPPPSAAGIDHIVVLTMENRSFDHFLDWLPGANGRYAGLRYLDRQGGRHATYRLTTY